MEKPNIKWVETEDLTLFFDKMPIVQERYITPFATEEETKDIKKYPFVCINSINIAVFDHKETKVYKFTIPNGYKWDGATINRLFWRLIGSNTDNNFLIASMLHDYMCTEKSSVDFNRSLSTNIFNACLKVAKVNPIKRFLMKNSVAMYQALFCDWEEI